MYCGQSGYFLNKPRINFEICGISPRLWLHLYLKLTQLTVTKREGSRLSFNHPYTETYGCGEVPPIEKTGDCVMEIRPARKAMPEIKPLSPIVGLYKGLGKLPHRRLCA